MSTAQAPGPPHHPDYARPPLVEVALGVQFRALPRLRPIELASLREQWINDYPVVQEQPPLAPTVESAGVAQPQVQLVIGPSTQTRLWFLRKDGAELVQIQNDRLTVNWRKADAAEQYPRYQAVRDVFRRRYDDLTAFTAARRLGTLELTQVEVNYVNAEDVEEEDLGRLELVFRGWKPSRGHHLGQAKQARAAFVYSIGDVGKAPVRLYVGANPAKRPNGRSALLFTFTVRGAPSGDGLAGALAFMDRAHDHIVRSFAELTSDAAQQRWGKQ